MEITEKNYLPEIEKIGLKTLPESFQKSHEMILKATGEGADWESYKKNPVLVRVFNLFFERLNQYVKKNAKPEKPVREKEKQEKSESKTELSAKDAAKKLIRHYVLRGDTLKQLKAGRLGLYSSEFSAEVRGNKIEVIKIGEEEVNKSYTLESIYNEILKEAGKSPAKIKAGSSAKERKENKEPENNKPDNKVHFTEHLEEEIKVIKRFVGLHDKVKTENSILSFAKSLNKAIAERRITKKSIYAKEITYILEKLVGWYNKMNGTIKALIEPAKLSKLVAIAGGEEVYTSVQIIKAFLSMQGRQIEANKRNLFLTRIERALKNKKVRADDPYIKEIKKIFKTIKAYKAKTYMSITKSELHGLEGLVKDCGCSLNGLEGIDDEETCETSSGGEEDLAPKENSGAYPEPINSMDFVKLQFPSIGFKGKYKEFIGDPAPGFSAMVFGKPKFGKSHWALGFAGYLARNHGKVLYVAKEEGLYSTLLNKFIETSVQHPNLELLDQVPSDLRKYQFVFIDSVTKLGLKPSDLEKLEKTYPYISFIYVHQVTKAGKCRGDNDFLHDVDIVIEVPEKGLAIQNGRYNQGGEMKIFDENVVEKYPQAV